jgi:hypothetical protein
MRLKRFNELYEADQPIKRKDIDEMIDEVLDRLSKKKKLSRSEREFMEEASRFTINDVTIPSPTGDFWADMGNPHNIGIMWRGKDDVWKQLKSVEDEEDEELEGKETSDETWERKKKRSILKYADELPGLVEIINDLALKVKKYDESLPKRVANYYNNKLMDLVKDKDFNYKYQFRQKVDYATNGTLHSLFNQFGPLITSIKEYDDDDE